jgi:predicted DNA-binding transcriptional regulator YafY
VHAFTPTRLFLKAKRLVTRADMMEVAEVSLATFKRDIAKLRDQMGMPILFDKDRAGYYLDRNNLSTEMPGLWFNPEELVAGLWDSMPCFPVPWCRPNILDGIGVLPL